MTTLDEAWNWYQSIARVARVSARLGARHWDELPWDGPLGRDPLLIELTAAQLETDARGAAQPLDDIAVIVLFSVFEATVRRRVLDELAPEADALRHAALKRAVADAREAIEVGSFFRVLELFKADGRADLIEHVNQVRKYRNWVAHGRHGPRPDQVDPPTAYERLGAFLALLTSPPSG